MIELRASVYWSYVFVAALGSQRPSIGGFVSSRLARLARIYFLV
jgi:hypothetical protein